MRSSLEIFDLASGTTRVVLQTPCLIEAPNWTRDGTLIVNGDGRLYRVPLDEPDLIEIDTGFATALNNDHGISPDGTRLAISDKTETGQSCIYILPKAGGTPTRITDAVPSYWHGWSPDGATLAYCACRNGVYGISTCPSDGGAEHRLTPERGHSDGPDYTPDGKWIWFNSDLDGPMALWRVRPDGRDLQRMYATEEVLWFPHPSPDGAHILFLAYPEGTQNHPRDLQVSLWLMRPDGTDARKLFDFFGGQGSINVPCWSLDGAAFAFMRYFREDT